MRFLELLHVTGLPGHGEPPVGLRGGREGRQIDPALRWPAPIGTPLLAFLKHLKNILNGIGENTYQKNERL